MSATTKILYINHRFEQYLLALALASVAVLSVSYVYLLSLSVVHVVASREIEERVSEIHGEIASLEAVYMERQHSISMEVVKSRGYASTGEKIFLNRESASVVTKR